MSNNKTGNQVNSANFNNKFLIYIIEGQSVLSLNVKNLISIYDFIFILVF